MFGMQPSLMLMPGAVHFVGWPMATMEHDLIGVSIHGNNAMLINIPLCLESVRRADPCVRPNWGMLLFGNGW